MVLKFLSSGFEREALQALDTIQNSSYNCIQCSEPITNPICHECLGEQIVEWLKLYPSVKRKMLPQIRKYVIDVNNDAVSTASCMACNSKKAALCPYCFTEGVFKMLKKNKIDKMIIMDFLSIFNFDLKHEGYIRDAASEGLW